MLSTLTSDTRQTALLARGRSLEYLTLGWNVLEAVVAGGAGLAAGSAALVGFALDSVIESLSGAVLLWRLQDGAGERRERVAQRLVAGCFALLAAYVAYEATSSLVTREGPDPSPVGIAIALASVIVMPLIARAKRRVAAGLGSTALVADSRQTDLCAYLSAVLLGGLLLNALLGWWWADPVAALCMVPIILNEARDAWRGHECGC